LKFRVYWIEWRKEDGLCWVDKTGVCAVIGKFSITNGPGVGIGDTVSVNNAVFGMDFGQTWK